MFVHPSLKRSAWAFALLAMATTTACERRLAGEEPWGSEDQPGMATAEPAPLVPAEPDETTPENAFRIQMAATDYTIPGSPALMDPHNAAYGPHYATLDLLFEGLLRPTVGGGLAEGAADWPKISEDGRALVFTIRPESTWSDGQPVLAQDFADAWFDVLDPANEAPYAFHLFVISGAEAYYTSRMDHDGKMTDTPKESVGIKILGANSLEVTMTRAGVGARYLFTEPVMFPTRRDIIDSDAPDKTELGTPVGVVSNGRFHLSSWAEDHGKLVVQRNPHWPAEFTEEDFTGVRVATNEETARAERFIIPTWGRGVKNQDDPANPSEHVEPGDDEEMDAIDLPAPSTDAAKKKPEPKARPKSAAPSSTAAAAPPSAEVSAEPRVIPGPAVISSAGSQAPNNGAPEPSNATGSQPGSATAPVSMPAPAAPSSAP